MVFVLFMMFFLGIVALVMMPMAAAFFNDHGGWEEAAGQRHAEAMQRHRAHISRGHGEL